MNTQKKGKIGIVVGGGPAPGINGVIGAATIEASRRGVEVIGILDGFKWISKGDTTHTKTLTPADVEEIRFKGGSILHTSRENPTKDPEKMRAVVDSLNKLGITRLVTIGGDDTAFSAYKTSEYANGAICVAHVPKTIDNDLPLPDSIPTFGYQTARDLGGKLIKNLLEDARTTRRWYIVVAMGRSAGHLALGMGITGGATITLIPEEFKNTSLSIETICSLIEGSKLKAKMAGQDYGIAIIAEGVGELVKEELAKNPLVVVKYDEHGHLRLAEVPFGLILKRSLDTAAEARKEKAGYVDITIGYELRCADPVPFDIEYTHLLGWAAADHLLHETIRDTGVLISIQAEKSVPIPLPEILDVHTGKTSVRRVTIDSDHYRGARALMTRIEPSDLEDPAMMKKLSDITGEDSSVLKKRFA
ncbi:MAG: 6-phosphofructokinase [Candidatus Ratteibacteria bacterium]